MKTNIVPVTIFPQTATSLEIVGANIRTFSSAGSANIVWVLLDASGNVLKSGAEELSGDDYQGWNDDEPYLINWLLPRLSLTPA